MFFNINHSLWIHMFYNPIFNYIVISLISQIRYFVILNSWHLYGFIHMPSIFLVHSSFLCLRSSFWDYFSSTLKCTHPLEVLFMRVFGRQSSKLAPKICTPSCLVYTFSIITSPWVWADLMNMMELYSCDFVVYQGLHGIYWCN